MAKQFKKIYIILSQWLILLNKMSISICWHYINGTCFFKWKMLNLRINGTYRKAEKERIWSAQLWHLWHLRQRIHSGEGKLADLWFSFLISQLRVAMTMTKERICYCHTRRKRFCPCTKMATETTAGQVRWGRTLKVFLRLGPWVSEGDSCKVGQRRKGGERGFWGGPARKASF